MLTDNSLDQKENNFNLCSLSTACSALLNLNCIVPTRYNITRVPVQCILHGYPCYEKSGSDMGKLRYGNLFLPRVIAVCTMEVLRAGDSFRTFNELEIKIQDFKRTFGIQLYKRDARTVDAAKKRVNRPLSAAYKYYEVRYCCISGGTAFKIRGRGIRETV